MELTLFNMKTISKVYENNSIANFLVRSNMYMRLHDKDMCIKGMAVIDFVSRILSISQCISESRYLQGEIPYKVMLKQLSMERRCNPNLVTALDVLKRKGLTVNRFLIDVHDNIYLTDGVVIEPDDYVESLNEAYNSVSSMVTTDTTLDYKIQKAKEELEQLENTFNMEKKTLIDLGKSMLIDKQNSLKDLEKLIDVKKKKYDLQKSIILKNVESNCVALNKHRDSIISNLKSLDGLIEDIDNEFNMYIDTTTKSMATINTNVTELANTLAKILTKVSKDESTLDTSSILEVVNDIKSMIKGIELVGKDTNLMSVKRTLDGLATDLANNYNNITKSKSIINTILDKLVDLKSLSEKEYNEISFLHTISDSANMMLDTKN